MNNRLLMLYRFAAEVIAINRTDTRFTLDVDGWRSLSFATKTAESADAIESLFGSGAALEDLQEIATAKGVLPDGDSALLYYIERFSRARLLTWEIVDQGISLAKVEPLASGYCPRIGPVPDGSLTLSRFAFLRNTPDGMVMESGLTRAKLIFSSNGLGRLFPLLGRARSYVEDGLVGILWRLGFFEDSSQSESESRQCWEFHDLLMHESSRMNRDLPIGGTYRFKDKFLSAPAIKPPMPGEQIKLPQVDESRVEAASQSINALQRRRKSIRTYSDQPIDLHTLAEFLWRVARTTNRVDLAHSSQALLSRNYPSGGSIHELEFYIAVRRCAGLEPGFYHYDGHMHCLKHLPNTEKIALKLVEKSGQAMTLTELDDMSDVTIVVSTRLPRLAWKYERMAYRASLVNAGVVIQLMYLIATDMSLAPCANGTGDSRLFEQATGLDPLEETSIAEFCLGLPASA